MVSGFRSLALTGLLALSSVGCAGSPGPELVTEVPWVESGPWLIADTHTHSEFSDGLYPVGEIVRRAAANGCDVLAITDHSDLSEEAATPEYFADIRAARAEVPGLVLFGGIEWNIPSYGGREHVTVLLSPELEESVLPEFKSEFEREGADDATALRWLAERLPAEDDGVLIYNHPSRKDETEDENARDMLAWRRNSELFIGFEGAPGHQLADPIGGYKYGIATLDRWDPLVAEIGGTWDRLLSQGHDVWAALASSDFHREREDEEPCRFARTHVQSPDRSASGVLRALRAGTFWADHGQLLDRLSVTLSTAGMPRPATPGETFRVGPKQPLRLAVTLERGLGARAAELDVEWIGNCDGEPPGLAGSRRLAPGQSTIEEELGEPQAGEDGESCYYRVRVRGSAADGTALLAYGNPIRVFVGAGKVGR